MRKVLIPVAALVLCAGPAAAQQSLATEAATPAQAAVAQAAEPQTPAANPSLFPTTAHVKAQGGRILTEAEASCVVYGMPRAVDEASLSDRSVPLEEMAGAIMETI